MRLYLSSYRLGNDPQKLLNLLNGKTKVAKIGNARDYKEPSERALSVAKDRVELEALGLEVEEIDLRDYFGKQADLKAKLLGFDLIWVTGGNVFILRQAMARSGFDNIIKDLLASDSVVYGGYSAGICVLSESLEGIDLVDDPTVVPEGYSTDVSYEGLSVVPYSLAPHYQSNHPESDDIDAVVEYFKTHNMPYKTLRDGDVLINS